MNYRICRLSYIFIIVTAMILFIIVYGISENKDIAYATSCPRAKITVVYNGRINVRQLPTTNSERVGRLKHGDRITSTAVNFVSGKKRNSKYLWYYVPAYKGYIRGDLLRINGYSYSAKGVLKASLNKRRGAGTGFSKIFTLKKKSRITILMTSKASNGNIWYKVLSGKGVAYMYAPPVRTSFSIPQVSKAEKKWDKPGATAKAPDYDELNKICYTEGKTVGKKTKAMAGCHPMESLVKYVPKNHHEKITAEIFTSPISNAPRSIWYYSEASRGYIRSDNVKIQTGSAVKAYTTRKTYLRVGAGKKFNRVKTLGAKGRVYICNKVYSSDKSVWYKVVDTVDYIDENAVSKHGRYYLYVAGKDVNIQVEKSYLQKPQNRILASSMYKIRGRRTNIIDGKPTDLGLKIAAKALEYEGNPYVKNGINIETGACCSGFTSQICRMFGIKLSTAVSKQTAKLKRTSNPRPGDLVWYYVLSNGKPLGKHVGIYLGKDRIIHASNTKNGTIVSRVALNRKYYFFKTN